MNCTASHLATGGTLWSCAKRQVFIGKRVRQGTLYKSKGLFFRPRLLLLGASEWPGFLGRLPLLSMDGEGPCDRLLVPDRNFKIFLGKVETMIRSGTKSRVWYHGH